MLAKDHRRSSAAKHSNRTEKDNTKRVVAMPNIKDVFLIISKTAFFFRRYHIYQISFEIASVLLKILLNRFKINKVTTH